MPLHSVAPTSAYFYAMLFSAQHLSYRDTAKFSKIVLDYIEGAPEHCGRFMHMRHRQTALSKPLKQSKSNQSTVKY